tara:strand:- start:20 stop:403 length:384 start_codon:yes stop_codon:yes gene_type:complete
MVPRDTLGAIPLMTKTLIPIGGLISASSITTTINIPNQTASNPNPLMMGKKTGRVKRIIAMVSRMAPSKIYISKIKSNIPIGGKDKANIQVSIMEGNWSRAIRFLKTMAPINIVKTIAVVSTESNRA